MKIRPALLIASVALWAGAYDACADDTTGRALAATCTGCHGTVGASAGAIPALAGLPQADLARMMREFRDEKRQATIMHQHAKAFDDAQIDAIAAWFAAQKR